MGSPGDLSETLRRGPGATVHPAFHPYGSVDPLPKDIPAAEHWLREQGCTHARGPLDQTTWHTYRANLGPWDRPPFLGEPTERSECWEAAGYQVVARYASTRCPHAPQIEAADRLGPKLVAAGWRLLTLDQLPSFGAALRTLHQLSTDAFVGATAYAPLSWPDFQALYAPFEGRIDPGLVLVAMAPDGSPGGLCFSLADPLNPGLREMVVKTLAVAPAWRQIGVGQWLVGEAHRAAQQRGLVAGIHALMAESSHSRAITAHGGVIFRRYALYEKAL
jgi:GNAT superfamily N-acetyltransferase